MWIPSISFCLSVFVRTRLSFWNKFTWGSIWLAEAYLSPLQLVFSVQRDSWGNGHAWPLRCFAPLLFGGLFTSPATAPPHPHLLTPRGQIKWAGPAETTGRIIQSVPTRDPEYMGQNGHCTFSPRCHLRGPILSRFPFEAKNKSNTATGISHGGPHGNGICPWSLNPFGWLF